MSDNERILTANFTADTSGFAPKINELIQKLKTLNQDFEQNKQKVNELNAKIKEYQKELNQLNTATNNGANATVQQERRMQELRDSIASCNTQIGNYRAAQATLRSEINSTNRELTEQQQAFNGVNTSAMSFGEILKANLASAAIQAGLRTTLNYLREAAAYCYQVGSSFEASMSQVAAVSGASADELERLTAKAKELGSSSKFTASQTAEAMNYMAMAGWKTEEMLAGIDGVLGLAAASGTDLATTADIVTDALTAFGLSASDCAHFADVLAAASSNANTNVAMMGETFKYCAPIAGALGFSAEDVAVGVGLMANSGIKATQAGTAMRTVMQALAKDVEITGRKIGTVTVETTNADGSMREFSEILTDLRTVFSQLDDDERALTAENIAGKNALSGFLALMNAGEADVQKLTAAIADCDGAASAMADTMQDNVQGAVTKFNSALEGVGTAVYDKFKDGLKETVNIFTEAMGELTKDVEFGEAGQSIELLAESFKNAATEIGKIAKDSLPDLISGFANTIDFVITFRKEIASAAAGFIAYKSAMSIGSLITGLVRSYKTLTTALHAAQAAQTGLNVAMDANPIGAIAAVVSLAVAGIVELVSHINSAADGVDELGKTTAEYAEDSQKLNDVKKRYEDITKAQKPAAEKTEELKELQDELIAQFPDLRYQVDSLADSYDGVAKSIKNLIDTQEKLTEDQTTIASQKENRGMAGDASKEVMRQIGISKGNAGEILKYYGITQDEFVAAENANSYEETLKIIKKAQEYTKANYPDQKEFLDYCKQAVKETEQAIAELTAAENRQKAYERQLNNKYLTYTDQFYVDPYDEEPEENNDRQYGLSRERMEEIYKQEKQLADDQYSVGEIGAEEYYNKLTKLRDTYLEKQSHAWYQATAQIQNIHEKMANGVKSALSEVEMAYKKTLDAIDAEIERHNRAKSDAAFQNKIDEIDSQLAYGRLDDFSRYELEKERQRLIDEHEEELYSRQAADAKAMIRDVYNAKTTLDKAEDGTREYTLAVGDYTDALHDLTEIMRGVGVALGVENNSTVNNSNTSIDESTKNYYSNIVLQAVNKTNSQLIDELIRALHSGL